jgi:ABC-type transport system involved in multi-copper enzyme maturation permease subunit
MARLYRAILDEAPLAAYIEPRARRRLLAFRPLAPKGTLSLLVGPVFNREVATAPRSWRLYFLRAVYVGVLFGLAATAWLIVFGSQPVRTLGDLARFGAAVFALIAPVQLAIVTGFAALLTAAAVAQEKDRRTLDLLLMTRMTNSELVLGKLLASTLSVLVLILAGIPFLMLLTLLGGVSFVQVARVVGVSITAAFAAGSLGSTIGLWREKTFQTLATTALALMLWLLLGEAIAGGAFGDSWVGSSIAKWAEAVSPVRAIFAAARPTTGEPPLVVAAPWLGDSVRMFMFVALAAGLLLNAIAIAMVRVWNPTRETRQQTEEESRDAAVHAADPNAHVDVHAAPGQVRQVWDNPILWREICTWAYGKKVVIVRIAFLAVFVACAVAAFRSLQTARPVYGEPMPAAAQPLIPLLILGLVLVNALAVTSITNERDSKALDLLLVTDLTPKEIIFGKLGGVMFNAKEMILLPALLCVAVWWYGRLSTENLVFVLLSFTVLNAFVAVLGIHAGMTYENSRTAVGVSLGTLLFLLLGVAVCMRMMVAFQTSFDYQLQAFAAFMLGGGIGLYVALGWRNPSPAIWWASIFAPLATFIVIVNFLRMSYGAAALVTILMYGFATAAMLIPAVHEFDVATGRTTAKDI